MFLDEMAKDQLLIFAFPLFLLIMLIEMYVDRKQKLGLYKGKDTWVSLSMAIAAAIVEFFPKLLAFIGL